jgi:F-type H+-transporting ATPase subunit epsilon
MAELRVSITSPDGPVFEGTASSVVIPEWSGELGILPRHAPLIARLGSGELRIRVAQAAVATSGGGTSGSVPGGAAVRSGSLLRFFVDGGFVQVRGGRVSVLATRVEPLAKLTPQVAEERLRGLLGNRPDRASPEAEREKFVADVQVARERVRVARRGAADGADR